MGTINEKKKEKAAEGKHLNYMGGLSYDLKSPISSLRMAASSCFFGEPMYYKEKGTSGSKHVGRGALSPESVKYLREMLNAIDPQEWRGFSPSEMMEYSIDKALDESVEETLELAVELRNTHNIRTTPQVILVRAANHKLSKGTGLIVKYAPGVIRRADEPAAGLAYQMSAYGKPVPNSLKKAWSGALRKFDGKSLAKYRMESRESKTVDVVNMSHPRPSEAIDSLIKGTLKLDGETWESLISSKGSSKESWLEALQVMGHMALLRNLRNLVDVGISTEVFAKKLKDGVRGGKQLPFRYFSAYKALEVLGKPAVLDVIAECMEISIENLPRFNGRVMSLCDNSGSAWGTTTSSMGQMHIAEIANLTGVITGKVSEEGYVGIFGDRLEVFPVRKTDSILTQAKALSGRSEEIGGSTENGIWLFWDQAIKGKEHWDHVFVYSDMQAGHGGLYGFCDSYQDFLYPGFGGRFIDVPKLICKYRREVNPNVMVYLVQVASYTDTIVPEFYDKTAILGGWSDSILKFASEFSRFQQ